MGIQQRQVQSCPASGIGAPPGLENDFDDAKATSWPLYEPFDNNGDALAKAVAAKALGSPMQLEVSSRAEALPELCAASALEVCEQVARPQAQQLLAPPSQAPMLGTLPQLPEMPAPSRAPLLCLSEVLPGPQLGSPSLPTVGSATHHLGSCQPCAFLHTKGCMNGVRCTFCHLCEPGEKKRRRKEKLAVMREARNQGKSSTHGRW